MKRYLLFWNQADRGLGDLCFSHSTQITFVCSKQVLRRRKARSSVLKICKTVLDLSCFGEGVLFRPRDVARSACATALRSWVCQHCSFVLTILLFLYFAVFKFGCGRDSTLRSDLPALEEKEDW
jgi:hypothetical protein